MDNQEWIEKMRSITKENWLRKNPGKTEQDFELYDIKKRANMEREAKERAEYEIQKTSYKISLYVFLIIRFAISALCTALIAWLLTLISSAPFMDIWIVMMIILPFRKLIL
jgi:hypothetical protein